MQASKKFRSSLVVLACGLTLAASAQAAVAWSTSRNVTSISVNSDPTGVGAGQVFVVFNSTPFTSGCNGTDAAWVLGGDSDTVKAMTQVALAAKLAGKPVKAAFNNSHTSFQSCDGGGTIGHPVLRGLEID